MPWAPKWQPEHDAMLKRLHRPGHLSFAEMAKQINNKFGTDFSRNAAIGRASRLGLRCCNDTLLAKRSAASVIGQKARSALAKSRPPKPTKPGKPMPKRQVFVCDDFTGLRQADVIPLNLPLLDLAPDQCRWPYGDGPYVFCGCEVWAKGPYCEPHASLSQGRGTESERRAHEMQSAA